MPDTWKKIPGFSQYSVSSSGEVRNDVRGLIKKPFVASNGYANVDLYRDGKRYKFRVHRLVGELFVPNPDELDFVNHKDGNKLNNDYSNLEWVTASYNMKHAYSTGLAKPSRGMLGKKNPNGGRNGHPVRVLETGEEFPSITACAKAINGNDRHICDCLSGRQSFHKGYSFELI